MYKTKAPNSGCVTPWHYKSMLCFACKQLSPQKWKSMKHISDPRPKKKAEVHSKTRKKAKVWRLVRSMWNRALTWMHLTYTGRWENTWLFKAKLAWESTQILSKNSDVFLWCLAQPSNVVLVYNLRCDMTRLRKDILCCASVNWYMQTIRTIIILMMKIIISYIQSLDFDFLQTSVFSNSAAIGCTAQFTHI